MAGEISRAAQARAEKEAAAKAEADAQEKARLEAEAAGKTEAEPEPEDDKEKKKTKGKKAEGDCPKDDEEDMGKAAAAARADASKIVELCADAGVPKLAASLITEGVTVAQAQERIDAAGEIRQMVGLARKLNPAIDTKEADNLIAAGASKAHAKSVLFDKLVSMQSPEIRNTHVASGGQPGVVPQGNHGWDMVIDKVANTFKPPVAPKH